MIDLPFTTSDVILIFVWFGVSLWNTSVGPTGGLTFATMAIILPPAAVIPLQAIVEAASSVFRVAILRRFIDLRFLAIFVVSGSIGFAFGLAARAYFLPSDRLLQVIMGSFILVSTWVPFSKFQLEGRKFSWLVGGLTSFISLFTGGIAPMIAAALYQEHNDHKAIIATMTASMLFQYTIKALIFGLLGFSFAAYGEIILAMFLAAIAGTFIGRHILLNAPQDFIRPIQKMLVTALGIKVLLDGLEGYWFS